jgi:hypothetical protein
LSKKQRLVTCGMGGHRVLCDRPAPLLRASLQRGRQLVPGRVSSSASALQHCFCPLAFPAAAAHCVPRLGWALRAAVSSPGCWEGPAARCCPGQLAPRLWVSFVPGGGRRSVRPQVLCRACAGALHVNPSVLAPVASCTITCRPLAGRRSRRAWLARPPAAARPAAGGAFRLGPQVCYAHALAASRLCDPSRPPDVVIVQQRVMLARVGLACRRLRVCCSFDGGAA